MRRIVPFLRRFRQTEDASATLEFALLVPLMITFCLSTIELGILLTRQVMLDRGLDLAVREVRIGTMFPVTHDALKEAICAGAMIIPDCMTQLKLEMMQVDPRAWAGLGARADCVNREEEAQPPRQFTPGMQNELVVLRACSLFDPFFPTSGLGAQIPRESAGAYALVSTTSYVVEPQ